MSKIKQLIRLAAKGKAQNDHLLIFSNDIQEIIGVTPSQFSEFLTEVRFKDWILKVTQHGGYPIFRGVSILRNTETGTETKISLHPNERAAFLSDLRRFNQE